jgi:hypothetical protein
MLNPIYQYKMDFTKLILEIHWKNDSRKFSSKTSCTYANDFVCGQQSNIAYHINEVLMST